MINTNIFSSLPDESKKIFNLILHSQALTKGSLSSLSGLKLTSLGRMMQPLIRMGLIVESQIGDSTGGRKPVLYDVNASKYYIIGIDISRTYTQVVLTNLKMQQIERYRFDMNEDSTPETTVSRINEWMTGIINKLGKQNSSVIGIGIGTVGPLDRKKGVILNPENFAAVGWENVQLKSIFEEKFGLPVVIDNGANAAVLSEAYYGIGKGIKNVIYINCGIGIRTGVISSGGFVRNINDAEDEFAHMIVDVNGKRCRCGNLGCIETYSSIYSIIENYVSALKGKNRGQFSFIDICRAADENEPVAREVLKNAAVIMGTGLANLIKLLSPGMVVLSGPLIKYSDLFYKECTETAYKKSLVQTERNVVFSKGGNFTDSAISIGAAVLVLESFIDTKGLN
jgi:predicted NBD/HSP70 family sugar kinase